MRAPTPIPSCVAHLGAWHDDGVSNSSSTQSRNAQLLARMAAMPRLTVPVIALFLFLVGAFAPNLYALPALALLTVFVGWLASLSWPVLGRSARLVRMVVIGLLVGVLAGRVIEALG